MSNPEVRLLKFEVETQGQVYLDLSSALTAVNHRQYHQVERDGSPLCYEVTIAPGSRAVNITDVQTAPNNWCTRNAVKMAAKGWRSQMRHAGLKDSQVARYGKHMRIMLNHWMGDTTTLPVSGREIESLRSAYVLQPRVGVDAGNPSGYAFLPYVDTGGDTIDYYDGNPITDCAVTDVALGTTTVQPFNLLEGPAGGSPVVFNILPEYHESRRNMETLETDLTPSTQSKMTTLFSTAEEASDEITEALDDTGDNRPYSDDSSMTSWGAFSVMRTPAATSSTSTGTDPTITSGQSEATCWPDCSKTITAPLGMLRLEGAMEGDVFFVNVHAIYEM